MSAALALFAEEGLDAPSLDAICDRAGFTRGAFYVHFEDRDALLVAVMEKVGATFLASVFAMQNVQVADSKSSTATEEGPKSILFEAARRFIGAIDAGLYPLMPPPKGGKRSTASTPQVKPHQLLDACARSPIVRERYIALVEASIQHVEQLMLVDQASGVLRADLNPRDVGTMMLALVIGAQNMAELGVPIDPSVLTRSMFAMLRSDPL